MTWTLAAMTSCYCLSVGPIFVCTLLEIEAGIAYIICFILYWFQVTVLRHIAIFIIFIDTPLKLILGL